MVPVHTWASEGERGSVGPVAPVLGALGQVGLPVQVLPPGLGGSLAEVTKLSSKSGEKQKLKCAGEGGGALRPPQSHRAPS